MNFLSFDIILLWLTKIFFLWYQFYVPYVYFNLTVTQLITNYLVMDLFAGIWLAYFFQVNHISEGLEYTSQDDQTTTTQKEWAVLQMEGTVEYSHGDPLFTFLSGTLNYQAVHHLFPSVAPHHYPKLAPILQRVARKHGVRYHVLPNFFSALVHHFSELHRVGSLGLHIQ